MQPDNIENFRYQYITFYTIINMLTKYSTFTEYKVLHKNIQRFEFYHPKQILKQLTIFHNTATFVICAKTKVSLEIQSDRNMRQHHVAIFALSSVKWLYATAPTTLPYCP
jgi:hypothetical protein